MRRKLRAGILFGGRSGEHEVSLLSAASILKAIDRDRFDAVPIGITKEGRWLTGGDASHLLTGEPAADEGIERRARDGARLPGAGGSEPIASARLLNDGIAALMPPERSHNGLASGIDVVFPVLHGTFGEDGTVQGLFELAGIAYVGSGVLGSAAGMDKSVMKRLFAQAGLPIVKDLTVLRAAWEKQPARIVRQIEEALKYPLFVKPANLGSSVGISKAHNRAELGPALDEAARYDRKLVVEQGVGGRARRDGSQAKAREFEVAVLGNDAPEASVVGEIVPGKEFYDYEAKYLSEGSVPVIPAKIARAEARRMREMAIEAFRACDLCGLARVDFLMEPDGRRRIFVNEVNTMPGFTRISMYPKLWQATGLSYSELISRLIDLAIERHADKKRNRYSRE